VRRHWAQGVVIGKYVYSVAEEDDEQEQDCEEAPPPAVKGGAASEDEEEACCGKVHAAADARGDYHAMPYSVA
jgi:hypothetical protein